MSNIPFPPTPFPRGFRKPPIPFPLPDFKVRPKVPPFTQQEMDNWAKAKASLKLSAKAICDLILYEIKAAVEAAGKTLTADALDEFAPALCGGVEKRLLDGGDWAADQVHVLAAARQMGTIAAILAGSSPQVAKAQVHVAFFAVQMGSTVCSSTSGSGSWCDFTI